MRSGRTNGRALDRLPPIAARRRARDRRAHVALCRDLRPLARHRGTPRLLSLAAGALARAARRASARLSSSRARPIKFSGALTMLTPDVNKPNPGTRRYLGDGVWWDASELPDIALTTRDHRAIVLKPAIAELLYTMLRQHLIRVGRVPER